MLPIPFPASTISLAYGAVDGEYYTFSSPHQGTDFSSRSQGVTAGTAIRASGPGRVVRSGVGPSGVSPSIDRPNNLAGNAIDVDYGDFIARYMHRPWDTPSPAVGSVTAEGTLLGVIGDTGLVSAAHLHMETWSKATGRRVNPANYFDYSRVVDASAAEKATPFIPPQEEDMTGLKMHHLVLTDGINQAYIVETATGFYIPGDDYRAALVKAYEIDLDKLPHLNEYDWNAVTDAKAQSLAGYASAQASPGADAVQIAAAVEARLRDEFVAIPGQVADEQAKRLAG